MQAVSQEDRDQDGVPDAAAEPPIVDAACDAQFLDGKVRLPESSDRASTCWAAAMA